MKKVLIILGMSLALAACGGKSGSSTGSDSTSDANKTAVATQSDAAPDTAASHNGTEKTGGVSSNAAGAQLIASNDCSTCHKETEKVIGPAFVDVAKKYKASPAVIDTLAHKVIAGGSGNWGTTPMASHPSLSVADAKTMVKYILALKK